MIRTLNYIAVWTPILIMTKCYYSQIVVYPVTLNERDNIRTKIRALLCFIRTGINYVNNVSGRIITFTIMALADTEPKAVGGIWYERHFHILACDLIWWTCQRTNYPTEWVVKGRFDSVIKFSIYIFFDHLFWIRLLGIEKYLTLKRFKNIISIPLNHRIQLITIRKRWMLLGNSIEVGPDTGKRVAIWKLKCCAFHGMRVKN